MGYVDCGDKSRDEILIEIVHRSNPNIENTTRKSMLRIQLLSTVLVAVFSFGILQAQESDSAVDLIKEV